MLPLVGGQGGLKPTRNLGVQLTLFQPGLADYAHHITPCPPGLENLTAHLNSVQAMYDFSLWQRLSRLK